MFLARAPLDRVSGAMRPPRNAYECTRVRVRAVGRSSRCNRWMRAPPGVELDEFMFLILSSLTRRAVAGAQGQALPSSHVFDSDFTPTLACMNMF
jgi:hypothetical protein